MDLLHKAKRISVACEYCRKRKKKCDGIRPACTLCTASQKECLYSGTVETRKRKQWDTDYMSVLEEQVSTLRAQVADLQQTPHTSLSLGLTEPSKDSSQRYSSGDSVETPELNDSKKYESPSVRKDLPLGVGQHAEQQNPGPELSSSAIDDLSSLVWRMNIGEKGDPTFIGPSGNFCVPSSADGFAARSEARCMPQTELGHPIPDVCYDIAIKNNLCSLFFSQLNTIHQFLPPSIKLAPDLYPFSDLGWTVLHSAVLASGALFSTVQKEREAGIEFSTCIDISAVQVCREQPSLLVVQALSIAAWRELSLDNHSSASIYLSMAGGLAVDLGLHVIGLDALSVSALSKELLAQERETRLRTFWAFFLVDRIAATMLGRNCVIPWRRVEVPLLQSVATHKESIDEIAFRYQCRLWQLHDNFMDQIYSYEFKALQFVHRNRLLLSARAELLAFKQNLPSTLLVQAPNSTTRPLRSIIFLQMSYQTSLLLIHRPYLREPPDSSSFTLALATMSSAATRITQYIQLFCKHYLQHSLDQPTPALPFVIHHALTASITHLLLATARTPSHISLARRKLQVCMGLFASLETIWPIASKAVAQLQELAVQWNVVGALPLKWSFVGAKDGSFQNTPVETEEGSTSLDGTPNSAEIHAQKKNADILHSHSVVDEEALLMMQEAQDDASGFSGFAFSGKGLETEALDQHEALANMDAASLWLDSRFLPDSFDFQDVFDFTEFNHPL